MITIDQMIQREVNCCLSSLVSTLAQGGHHVAHDHATKELAELCEQAYELASPVLDYEEALCQAGWYPASPELLAQGFWEWQHKDGEQSDKSPDTLCAIHDIEPYEGEVYEHWSVSNWLAHKLVAQGEKVDMDFAGMNVWARTTTGQGIANDTPIQKIYADMIGPPEYVR